MQNLLAHPHDPHNNTVSVGGDLNNLICIGLLLDNIFEQMTQITVPVEDMSLHLEPAENVRIPED